jgi:hypothetical protein
MSTTILCIPASQESRLSNWFPWPGVKDEDQGGSWFLLMESPALHVALPIHGTRCHEEEPIANQKHFCPLLSSQQEVRFYNVLCTPS